MASEAKPDNGDAAKADAEATANEAARTAEECADEGAESIESLRVALEDAQAEVAACKDQALRAAAEAENVRKRAERSIENAHKFALEGFVTDLLPAVDSFERAVQTAADAEAKDETVAAMTEGIELSLKLLVEAMQRQGIETVDPVGAPFDPVLHEAMTMVEAAEAEPGSVVQVVQKGYTVNGRLARPARVIVARQPADPPSASADEP